MPKKTRETFERFPQTKKFKFILENFGNFKAEVIKVIDGDTVDVRWEREEFPIRMVGIDAPEMNEKGGKESQSWLEGRILHEMVEIQTDKRNLVDKWGRLLGKIYSRGLNMSQAAIWSNKAVPFDRRDEGKIPDFRKEFIKRNFS